MVSLLVSIALAAFAMGQNPPAGPTTDQVSDEFEYVYSPDPYFMSRIAAMAEAKGLPPPMMIPMEGPPPPGSHSPIIADSSPRPQPHETDTDTDLYEPRYYTDDQ